MAGDRWRSATLLPKGGGGGECVVCAGGWRERRVGRYQRGALCACAARMQCARARGARSRRSGACGWWQIPPACPLSGSNGAARPTTMPLRHPRCACMCAVAAAWGVWGGGVWEVGQAGKEGERAVSRCPV